MDEIIKMVLDKFYVIFHYTKISRTNEKLLSKTNYTNGLTKEILSKHLSNKVEYTATNYRDSSNFSRFLILTAFSK